MKGKKIILIGTGNVATQLGLALHSLNYSILQVYSPTKRNASNLARRINSTPITNLKEINQEADIFIIAVKDDAIDAVVKQLKLADKMVVHTSGSVDINVLKDCSENYGVFYPLQTISKNRNIQFKNIPICIEANNPRTSVSLFEFAKSISDNVKKVNSEQRKVLHLAAVFASNFSNYLYTIANDLLAEKKLSFDLLLPLIEETVNKIKIRKPSEMQTGPASRGDKKTMEKHLNMLRENKEYSEVYKLLSNGILHSLKDNK